MNKSVINSYRTRPGPTQQQPPVIAGRIVPVNVKPDPRAALVLLAVLVLPLLAIGVVVYAAQVVQAGPTPTPSPAVEVPAAPVVAVTPASEAQVAQSTPQPTQVAPQVRPANAQAAPTPVPGPQERLLSRGCEYRRQTYPQGTIIQGFYTDAAGKPRPAVCRVDGWKAAD